MEKNQKLALKYLKNRISDGSINYLECCIIIAHLSTQIPVSNQYLDRQVINKIKVLKHIHPQILTRLSKTLMYCVN